MSHPLVLVRGFGFFDVSDEQRSAYQGFNDGTVYPEKRGLNYIYEGFVLRAMKSTCHPYRDATNVVNYYPRDAAPIMRSDGWPTDLVTGSVVVDPRAAREFIADGVDRTLWVLRYYDLRERTIGNFASALIKLVEIIREGASRAGQSFHGVDVVAHSMGGLIVNEAIRRLSSEPSARLGDARSTFHRIVTLGTPHRGIAFQYLPRQIAMSVPGLSVAGNEIDSFDPDNTAFLDVVDDRNFDKERILTVVGTNFRSYAVSAATWGNRLTSLIDEGSLAYNKSDGLVKISSAQLPGAPRTFVHKCHGGVDSLVTSREAYEIATRFFHASHRVRLHLTTANVTRGQDFFGKSEFYFGVSIKPRLYDFELFHQSPEAQNMYGPFEDSALLQGPPPLQEQLKQPLSAPGDDVGGWTEVDVERRLIWQGYVDTSANPDDLQNELVFRVDVNVSERDAFGVGFSDNIVFRKQYYVQYVLRDHVLYIHNSEKYLGSENVSTVQDLDRLADDAAVTAVERARSDGTGSYSFDIHGTGFTATMAVEIDDMVDHS